MPRPTPTAPEAGRGTAAPSAAPATRPATRSAARSDATARHFGGIPSVGVLFSVDGDTKAHHCTASVVHSPHGNLILTAGHCNPGTRAAFVPQYRSGATTQPYGVWAIDDTFAYPGRGTTGAAADLDFAFATVAPDEDGRTLEEITGGNTLYRDARLHQRRHRRRLPERPPRPRGPGRTLRHPHQPADRHP